MDHRSLSNLLIRLTGVIILLSSILEMPRTVVSLSTTIDQGDSLESAIVMSALAVLLPSLIGLFLLWFPDTVTNRLLSRPESEAAVAVDYKKLQQLAFCALGLYFISSALYDALYWFAKVKMYYSVFAVELTYMKAPTLLPDDFAGIVSTALQFVIGIVLLLGGNGISTFVSKLRG
ncbi:MAG: hypothetical protein WC236_00220 [Gallionellaceae bacterium]|jgi:hypothetical protein